MRLLNKYVLREWLISFVAVYLIVSALLLLEDVYNNFYLIIIVEWLIYMDAYWIYKNVYLKICVDFDCTAFRKYDL